MTRSLPTDEELLSLSLDDLLALSRARRVDLFGHVVTFSPKVFIPLTMLCRDRCGYCTFAKAPAHVPHPYMAIDEVLDIARKGRDAGCHEALFTLGEAPEERYPAAREWLEEGGWTSTVDYLVEACRVVREETGLLPHANAGALGDGDLAALKEVSASQGMMIETLKWPLDAHRGSPDKTPERRLATLDAAGRLGIPFTTGILVGIGESRQDRLDALRAIAASAERYGHVQEVIVQNFLPKSGTSMHRSPACPADEHFWAIGVARLLLPDAVHLQAPPNLSDDLAPLLATGIDDWGGVSPLTADHVNPERAWPALDLLRRATEDAGHTLVERLTAYPEYVRTAFGVPAGGLATRRSVDPEPSGATSPSLATWFGSAMRPAILAASDAEGYARDHQWCSGGTVEPPDLLTRDTASPRQLHDPAAITEVLEAATRGEELGESEIVTLFSARGAAVRLVCDMADRFRREICGDEVTYVLNRNINYTNVCTFKCRFCAFSKGPLSLNLRGAPYLLDLDEISRRVAEAEELGATEVCLQGGIHPNFDGGYYLDVLRAVRAASETIHIHAFTALEVSEGARRSGLSLEVYLKELKAAGLRTLPGTAAEILDDPVREVLCPDKVRTDEWLEVHRVAHRVGLRSNITIMFGAIEHPESWARHMLRTRSLQKETGGFTEFVPLPFVHMAAPMFLQGRARRGPTFRENLLMHAVARIVYRGLVDHIQVSWVKGGAEGARLCLRAGADDLGGTLMDENISRAAGASHGQNMGVDDLTAIVAPLGRPLVRRTTLYGRPDDPTTADGPSFRAQVPVSVTVPVVS